jgi:hypothetical protein
MFILQSHLRIQLKRESEGHALSLTKIKETNKEEIEAE